MRVFAPLFLPLFLALGLWIAPARLGLADPFEHGWQLSPQGSSLHFTSIKKGNVAETSTFATFSGSISATGTAEIRVALDSVDTQIDLRNVRMRFLFFETFLHPEAVITAQLDPALFATLLQDRRRVIDLPLTLSLHGVDTDLRVPVAATALDIDHVSVATVHPLILRVADYDLLAGLAKLEEAASVTITPVTLVSFDLHFSRNAAGTPPPVEAPKPAATTALETTGNFDLTACAGRFEILSRANSIGFVPAGTALDSSARALLDNLADIIRRCPDLVIEIGGHTDSQGAAAWNRQLSERRAQSVASYLQDSGIDASRLVARGYGEDQPLVSNATPQDRARNRRIEFKILN